MEELARLAELVVEIVEDLQREMSVIHFARGHGLSYVDLCLQGLSGDMANGKIFDVEDEHTHSLAPKEPIEKVADALVHLVNYPAASCEAWPDAGPIGWLTVSPPGADMPLWARLMAATRSAFDW